MLVERENVMISNSLFHLEHISIQGTLETDAMFS